MRRRHRSALLATTLALVATVHLSAQEDSAAGAADDGIDILKSERALFEAMHARDGTMLDQLLASDYILRGSPDIDRATWIQTAITRCWGSRSDINSFRAREEEGVVIASFELTFYVDPASCRPAILRSLITDVWTRFPDGWRLSVRHSGPPPSPGGGIVAQFGIVPLPPPTWDVNGELSAVATTGNSSTRTIGLRSDVIHRSRATTTRASVAFLTSEAESVTRARSFSAQGRHGIRVGRRTELYGRAAYARDTFAGIQNRASADLGAAYTAALPRRHVLTAEFGAGFTYEERFDSSDPRFASSTVALNYILRISNSAELRQDTSITADLHHGDNWRGLSTTSVNVTLTRLLGLKASNALEYRHTPVAGFGTTDNRTGVALVITFQRRPPIP